jgi:hypothetical protein
LSESVSNGLSPSNSLNQVHECRKEFFIRHVSDQAIKRSPHLQLMKTSQW